MTTPDEPRGPQDDHPPICPACGVTNFLVLRDDEAAFVCVECGFDERNQD